MSVGVLEIIDLTDRSIEVVQIAANPGTDIDKAGVGDDEGMRCQMFADDERNHVRPIESFIFQRWSRHHDLAPGAAGFMPAPALSVKERRRLPLRHRAGARSVLQRVALFLELSHPLKTGQ